MCTQIGEGCGQTAIASTSLMDDDISVMFMKWSTDMYSFVHFAAVDTITLPNRLPQNVSHLHALNNCFEYWISFRGTGHSSRRAEQENVDASVYDRINSRQFIQFLRTRNARIV